MKRMIISLILLAAITGVYIIEINMLNSIFTPITNDLNQAVELVESEQYTDASKLCEDIEKQWQKHENTLSVFINHDIINELGLSTAKLPALATSETADEFLAECNLVKVTLIHIQNNEYPSVNNIL